jgi:predicted ThiF/HesA family dinucleotide-utilizing enzyme
MGGGVTKQVAIVGVGALGSHAGLFLRNEAGFRVIDFDRVEQKNVLSQFHGRQAVGKNKALGFSHLMDFLFQVKPRIIPHRLTEDNARQLLGGADLVLDCLDNGRSRELVQGFVRKAGIPCLHGALSADGSFGRVVWDEAFEIDYEDEEGAATCEDGANLPFIGTVSAFMAKAAQEFLKTGRKTGYYVHPGGVEKA